MKKLLLSICIGLCVFMCSTNTSADQDMRKIFDYYSKGSAGTYTAGGMKHWAGASYSYRNRLTQPNLYSFTAPSIKAGCAGIDFYAGSFSLITKDELVQMARGIAQGAPGYFFNLAVGSICSSCLQAINEFMQKLNKFNELAKGSCEKFNQFAFDNTLGPLLKQEGNNKSKGNMLDAAAGQLDDWGASMDKYYNELETGLSSGGLSTDTAKTVHDENILFRRLTEAYDNNFAPIPIPGIGIDKRELAMSLFGTVIIKSEDGNTKMPEYIPRGPTIEIDQLLSGTRNEAGFYVCDDLASPTNPQCLGMYRGIDASGYDGLVKYMLDKLDKDSDSILGRIYDRRQLSASQVDFITAYDLPYISMAAEKKKNRTKDLAKYFATDLAYDIVQRLFRDSKRMVKKAIIYGENQGHKVDQMEKLLQIMAGKEDDFEESRQKANKEKKMIIAQYSLFDALENLTDKNR